MLRIAAFFAMVVGCIALGALSVVPKPSMAFQATPPAAPAPLVIVSEVLVRATPATVENPELALGRVTIMPGAAIPTHFHPGTQIAVVVQGTLTYSVLTPEVRLIRSGDPAESSEPIEPGATVQVQVGDALIESPGSIHQGRNEGTIPVVIYLSTLFPDGAPRSIPAGTPVPS